MTMTTNAIIELTNSFYSVKYFDVAYISITESCHFQSGIVILLNFYFTKSIYIWDWVLLNYNYYVKIN